MGLKNAAARSPAVCLPEISPALHRRARQDPELATPDAAMPSRIIYSLALCAILPCAARADVNLPTGGTLKQVDFERHVMGLLSKVGCNAGSCHGSFQGKNGFRLSLFGYDPSKDYTALTRDALGRRLDRVEPDRSLLLLK